MNEFREERRQEKEKTFVALASSKDEVDNLEIKSGGKEPISATKATGLRPPQDLNIDGAKIWLKAVNRLTSIGHDVEPFIEEAYMLAIMWQKFVKRARAGRDVKTQDIAAITKKLYTFGLSLGNKGVKQGIGGITGMKKDRRSRAQALAEKLRGNDDDE